MTLAAPMNAISDILFQASPFDNTATTTITSSLESTISTTEIASEPATAKSGFEAFAEAVRSDLPANSVLEKVLIERVILASWRLQVASEQDIERIVFKDKVTPVTSEILRAECSLETAFSLLETARRVSRPRWGRSSEAELASRAVRVDDTKADDTGDLVEDLSNEWPILNADSNPRDAFREINRETFDDQEIEDDSDSDSEPTRWQDRLVFDFNVSEASPVVKGTWITVAQVVSLVVDGSRWSDILRDHPELTEDDIRTCLAYTVEQDDFGNV